MKRFYSCKGILLLKPVQCARIVSKGTASHSFSMIKNCWVYKEFTISILIAISIQGFQIAFVNQWQLQGQSGIEKDSWWMEWCWVYSASLSCQEDHLLTRSTVLFHFLTFLDGVPQIVIPCDKDVYTVSQLWEVQYIQLWEVQHPVWCMGKHLNIWTIPENVKISQTRLHHYNNINNKLFP